MIGIYLDYFETFTPKELINAIKEANKNLDKVSSQQLEELGIDDNYESESCFKKYISVKCTNCSLTVAVFNSDNERYIIFNCI